MRYLSLTDDIRRIAAEELDADLVSGGAYFSPRLTSAGVNLFHAALREALLGHDDAWLARRLWSTGLLRGKEFIPSRGGYWKELSYNAAVTLAEGEFNHYYIRAACRAAIHAGRKVLVYRAKQVLHPRMESERRLGSAEDPISLLGMLRARTRQDHNPGGGVPTGPNSGLSVLIAAA